MFRARALKIALILVGLLFAAAAYPAIGGLRNPANSDTGDTMMMGIYLTLGIFLLIAARNPAAHRSLIAFAAHQGVLPGCNSLQPAPEARCEVSPVREHWVRVIKRVERRRRDTPCHSRCCFILSS